MRQVRIHSIDFWQIKRTKIDEPKSGPTSCSQPMYLSIHGSASPRKSLFDLLWACTEEVRGYDQLKASGEIKALAEKVLPLKNHVTLARA